MIGRWKQQPTDPHNMRPRSRVEEQVLTVTTMEINKGLRRPSAPSSRRVPNYLRIIIREEGIVPKVYDEVLPHYWNGISAPSADC